MGCGREVTFADILTGEHRPGECVAAYVQRGRQLEQIEDLFAGWNTEDSTPRDGGGWTHEDEAERANERLRQVRLVIEGRNMGSIKHVGPYKSGVTTIYVSEGFYDRFFGGLQVAFAAAEPFIETSIERRESVRFSYEGTDCLVRYYPGLRCGICTHLELQSEQPIVSAGEV
jgi:hypothetical protein